MIHLALIPALGILQKVKVFSVSSAKLAVGVQAEAVARFVEQAGADIDRHVVEVLLDKFQLTAHCAAIKRYLLLGQVHHLLQAPLSCCCSIQTLPAHKYSLQFV